MPVHRNEPWLVVNTIRATAFAALVKPAVGLARQTMSFWQESLSPMAMVIMSRGLAVGLISRCDSCGMLRLKFSGYSPAGSDSSTSRFSPLTVGDHPMSLPLAAKLAPDCSKTRPSSPAKRSVALDGSPGVAPAPRSISDARNAAACAELTSGWPRASHRGPSANRAWRGSPSAVRLHAKNRSAAVAHA